MWIIINSPNRKTFYPRISKLNFVHFFRFLRSQLLRRCHTEIIMPTHPHQVGVTRIHPLKFSPTCLPYQTYPWQSMSWSLKNEYLALAGGQNILQIFSNLRVCTFQKTVMNCPNWQLLVKNLKRYFADQNGPKRGPHENEF